MPHHEDKTCLRCGEVFECKVGNVLECQCNTIVLSEEQREAIRKSFDDCLCISCLHEIQALAIGK